MPLRPRFVYTSLPPWTCAAFGTMNVISINTTKGNHVSDTGARP